MDLLTDHLAEARSASQRGDWTAAYRALSHADAVGPMTADDVDAFAAAAWRLGHAQESARLGERVYDRLVRADPAAAAMKATDVALQWFTRGDANVGQSWVDRARRLLAGAPTAATHGYLAYLVATATVRVGDAGGLADAVSAMRDVCAVVDDAALVPLSATVSALDAYRANRFDEGDASADRAIVAVESGELRLEWAGDVYALLLLAGRTLGDGQRMQRWTESMARWCATHDAVLYHRVLRIHLTPTESELLAESAALAGVHALAVAECSARLGEMRRAQASH